MSDWTAGYVADIDYTYGYYAELNPLRLRLAFLQNGLVCPEVGTACELGFGQGLSTNLHAAASITRWYGTDFNPAQAGFAQELARFSGATMSDDSFAEFAERSDLPEFDYIGLHGIWSWVSDENRSVIVDFIRKKLKVGGVLYISYNTQPGWSGFAPIRQLFSAHAEVMGTQGQGVLGRVSGAVEFAEKLFAVNPLYLQVNPLVIERFNKAKGLNPHYLAHEYFNRDWHPMYFRDMAGWLEAAKLQFACSAHYLDHVEGLNLKEEQRAFLKEIPDPLFREGVRDFMVNQQFRRDYWVRGARKLSLLEQMDAIRAERVVLSTHRASVSLKVTGSLGEASMSEDIYNPILDLLADYQPRTIAEIEQALVGETMSFVNLMQAIMVLAGAGHIASVQKAEVIEAQRPRTDSLNQYLMKKARGNSELGHLASPVTGGGVAVGRFQQLFLLALLSGKTKPEEWAAFAWRSLVATGQKLIKEGVALESEKDSLVELTSLADAFAEKQLPVMKALQIV
ncbi:MAG: class I SAM-dependent methyltransferase [Gammaproteobacteria bacterium]|nr:class I SAM-dependent methyltransferase [Gammaproteobacteria bacterium]